MTAFFNLFLFVWISLTREAVAVLSVDKRASFDSMPAMFGSPWVTDTQYQARLQALPARPFLCEDDETASFVTTKNWGRRLGQLDTNNITQQLERKLVQNELPIALLVSRGACSYKEKAREAMKLQNVDFVIVFDDQAKQPLLPMTSSDSSEVKICTCYLYLMEQDCIYSSCSEANPVTPDQKGVCSLLWMVRYRPMPMGQTIQTMLTRI
ncbi:hypothetical protein MHU86_4017 [Fragilaria crotonensis]|nr:hypothetical protein MHU86_4017 [Fragilaria crotonensis]